MAAEPVQAQDQGALLREVVQRVNEFSVDTAWPQLSGVLTTLGPMLHERQAFTAALASPEFQEAIRQALEFFAAADPSELRAVGPARKVSVSMPEDLTAAVQQRVGHGKFSQYVTEAVTRQLELDLLAELSALLAAEHGPVPEEDLAEARAAWPSGE